MSETETTSVSVRTTRAARADRLAARVTQVIPMAVSLAAAVVLMRALPGGGGVIVALGLVLAVAAFCFWPLSGRSAEEWLPIAAAHIWRRANGRHRQLSEAPDGGCPRKRVGTA